MKFVWEGGGPAWSWWQLLVYNLLQRRAERRLRAERDAAGIPYSLDWWP